MAAGRTGRLSRLPLQLGHLSFSTDVAHDEQNVHSKVQINASMDSGGRSLLQHSQFGLISSTITSVQIVRSDRIAFVVRLKITHPAKYIVTPTPNITRISSK